MSGRVKVKTDTGLRKLRYRLLPPVGLGKISVVGDVFTLLLDIPYFFPAKIIPPLHIVNKVLRTGQMDAGMSGGCEWKPFQIDNDDYEKLVKVLKKQRFIAIKPPDWLQTERDWHSWCAEVVWGIPGVEYSRLSNESHSLEQKRLAALEVGDQQLAHELYCRQSDCLKIQMDLVNTHRLSKRKIPSTASLRHRLHISRVESRK